MPDTQSLCIIGQCIICTMTAIFDIASNAYMTICVCYKLNDNYFMEKYYAQFGEGLKPADNSEGIRKAITELSSAMKDSSPQSVAIDEDDKRQHPEQMPHIVKMQRKKKNPQKERMCQVRVGSKVAAVIDAVKCIDRMSGKSSRTTNEIFTELVTAGLSSLYPDAVKLLNLTRK